MDCPLEDSTLAVHVTGSLPDGTVFWDTRNSVGGGESAPLAEVAGDPYEFATGEGLVSISQPFTLNLANEWWVRRC